MGDSFRRVVTGHDEEGRSVIVSDGPAIRMVRRDEKDALAIDFWETYSTPASNTGADETCSSPFSMLPPKNGSIFRMVEIPPDSVRVGFLRNAASSSSSQQISEGYTRDYSNPRHPGFHATRTIDYVVVMSGEIVAMMDEGETVLKPGDVLIQRGTNHSWSNRGSGSALLAVVMIDAASMGP